MIRIRSYIFGAAILATLFLSQSAALAQETITDIKDAWVRLFDDKSFKDRVLVVKGKENIIDMDKATSEDGRKGFGDKASSARFQIPKGWKLVLFDDNNNRDSSLELKGTGKVVEMSDFGSFSDKTSACRWEQDPQ